VHGVLLLDKPLGLSSNDALQRAKRLFRAEKAGHTGTLDPLATGLLPLCFGAATKFSQVSLDADKCYLALLKLGETRDGGDLEGEVLQRRDVDVDLPRLEAACAQFRGEIAQVPPMRSALKHEGKPLYEYARAGVEVARPERRVQIHAIRVGAWNPETAEARIEVTCSKGTYIRTLAGDIGETLGCGAHLAGLRRLGSGALGVGSAVTLDHLEALTEAERDELLQHPDVLVAEWPEVRLSAPEASRFLTGLRRRVDMPDTPHVRVYGPEPRALLGIAHVTANELIADRLLSPAEVDALITP